MLVVGLSSICFANMQVNIEVCYSVSFENSPQWMIKAEDVKTVDNVVFVKVRPCDPQFCKFLAHGFLELPKRCRPSLAQCPGWKALLKCRNDKALEQTANPDQEASLFGSDQKQTAKKLVRNAAQLQELRDNPEVMEFTVPGVEGSPDLNVSTIKPAHPCDGLCLPLDGDSIQHVVLFLRDVGVDLDNLLSKRQYGGMDMGGVWRNGGASIVKSLAQTRKNLKVRANPRSSASFSDSTGKLWLHCRMSHLSPTVRLKGSRASQVKHSQLQMHSSSLWLLSTFA